MPVLIFSLVEVFPRWYSHLGMYLSVDSHTCSFISCSYPHMVKYPTVGINTWSWIPMLHFSLGHVSPFWYEQWIMYSLADMDTWSCIPILIFILGYILLYWYSCMDMYPAIESLTCSCVPILIFTLVHVLLC